MIPPLPLAVLVLAIPSVQTGAPDLERVATVGCRTCTDARALSVVHGVELLGDDLLVADRDPPHIRVFGRDGTLIATHGAEGDGPGELRFPVAVGVRPDGGWTVVDLRRSSILLHDAFGGELERVPIGFAAGVALSPDATTVWIARADFRSGHTVLERWTRGMDAPAPVPEAGALWELAPPGSPPVFGGLSVAPDGTIAVGSGEDAYRIRLLDATAASAGEVVRDIDPPAAGTHFSVDALKHDPSGRLWVRTDRGGEGTVFDVFRGTRFLGEVDVPARVQAFALREDLLLGVVLDEVDLPVIGVWRVVERP